MSAERRPTVPPAGRVGAVVSDLVKGSYWLSRGWSWCCRIEVRPRVRVPVPRLFTHRDP